MIFCPVLLLVLVSQFFNSFVGPNGTLLNMAGKENKEMQNGIVKLVIGLSLGFVLGPLFEWGIAMSIAVSEIVINILKLIQVKKIYDIYPYNIKHFFFISSIAASFFLLCCYD